MENFRKLILGIALLATPSVLFAGTGDIKKGHDMIVKAPAIVNISKIAVADGDLNKNAFNIHQDKLNESKILTNYASRLKFRTYCALSLKNDSFRNRA